MSVPSTPNPTLPPAIFDDTRIISSCSRYTASTFGSQVFAGLVNPWDNQATHKQELLMAYVMGIARLLVAKEVFTQDEFVTEVQEWLDGRKEWSQEIANQTIAAWNADNPSQAQPELDVNALSFRNVEPPTDFPVWPWQFDPQEDPVEE